MAPKKKVEAVEEELVDGVVEAPEAEVEESSGDEDFPAQIPATNVFGEMVKHGSKFRYYNAKGQAISPVTDEGSEEAKKLHKSISHAKAQIVKRSALDQKPG